MHAISSYRGNRPTHPHTNPQTGPITIRCADKLSAQCNKTSDVDLCNAVALNHLIQQLHLRLGCDLTLFDGRSTARHTWGRHSDTSVAADSLVQQPQWPNQHQCIAWTVNRRLKTAIRRWFLVKLIWEFGNSNSSNKLCAWRHNMPPPAVCRTLRPSCSPSLTPVAPSAPFFQ